MTQTYGARCTVGGAVPMLSMSTSSCATCRPCTAAMVLEALRDGADQGGACACVFTMRKRGHSTSPGMHCHGHGADLLLGFARLMKLMKRPLCMTIHAHAPDAQLLVRLRPGPLRIQGAAGCRSNTCKLVDSPSQGTQAHTPSSNL